MHQVATWLNAGEDRTAFSFRDGVHGQGIDGVWCSGKQAVMPTKGQII